MEERNIKLISLEDFKSFKHLQFNNKLSKEEKQFSFLNSYFVFQKQNVYVNEEDITSELSQQTSQTSLSTQSNQTDKLIKDKQNLIKKIRQCLNLLHTFFESYEKFLISRRLN